MFVERWMTPDPVTLPPETTISKAALEMSRRKFRHFPIVEPSRSGPRLVGIIAKYDVARGFPSNLNPFSIEVHEESVPRPVSSVMTRNVITTNLYCPVEEAAKTLRIHRIGALPVMRDNRLMGIITESDIFEALISVTAAKSGGTRIMIASDSRRSPVPDIIMLSKRHRLDLMSVLSFHENRLRDQDLSIFRFANRLPAEFLQDIAELGFRVVTAGS
jgi:acetoin utilization protein AcuB